MAKYCITWFDCYIIDPNTKHDLWYTGTQEEDDEAYSFLYKLNTPLAWIRSYDLGYVEKPSHLKEDLPFGYDMELVTTKHPTSILLL